MISFLKGTLVSKTADSPRGAFFIVEVQGIGYEVHTNDRSSMAAPAVGETILLYTSMIVREDAISLVGFLTKEERDLFNILQSAGGVGIKVALALLSALSVLEIVQAVLSENFKALTAAKGIGPKLAQKIILELKEKMAAWREFTLGYAEHIVEGGIRIPDTDAYLEAETVLLSLGYTREEILQSLSAVAEKKPDPSANSETILRESLRWLATV